MAIGSGLKIGLSLGLGLRLKEQEAVCEHIMMGIWGAAKRCAEMYAIIPRVRRWVWRRRERVVPLPSDFKASMYMLEEAWRREAACVGPL